MIDVTAQVSIYPLRQPRLSPTIEKAVEVFRAHGLIVHLGAMSTLVAGNEDAIFAALKEALRSAATQGDVVMAVTFSNACPTPTTSDRSA
jgi:uncharacterized protein YqgV (UPF0045/DUF77 family)